MEEPEAGMNALAAVEGIGGGMRQALEPEQDLDGSPSRGCLLVAAFCCFFWAAVLLIVAWRWGWF